MPKVICEYTKWTCTTWDFEGKECNEACWEGEFTDCAPCEGTYYRAKARTDIDKEAQKGIICIGGVSCDNIKSKTIKLYKEVKEIIIDEESVKIGRQIIPKSDICYLSVDYGDGKGFIEESEKED